MVASSSPAPGSCLLHLHELLGRALVKTHFDKPAPVLPCPAHFPSSPKNISAQSRQIPQQNRPNWTRLHHASLHSGALDTTVFTGAIVTAPAAQEVTRCVSSGGPQTAKPRAFTTLPLPAKDQGYHLASVLHRLEKQLQHSTTLLVHCNKPLESKRFW